jgi:hypothetical protein
MTSTLHQAVIGPLSFLISPPRVLGIDTAEAQAAKAGQIDWRWAAGVDARAYGQSSFFENLLQLVLV